MTATIISNIGDKYCRGHSNVHGVSNSVRFSRPCPFLCRRAAAVISATSFSDWRSSQSGCQSNCHKRTDGKTLRFSNWNSKGLIELCDVEQFNWFFYFKGLMNVNNRRMLKQDCDMYPSGLGFWSHRNTFIVPSHRWIPVFHLLHKCFNHYGSKNDPFLTKCASISHGKSIVPLKLLSADIEWISRGFRIDRWKITHNETPRFNHSKVRLDSRKWVLVAYSWITLGLFKSKHKTVCVWESY